jgi:hypothetical protein
MHLGAVSLRRCTAFLLNVAHTPFGAKLMRSEGFFQIYWRYSCNLLRQLIVIISAFRMYLQETSKRFLTQMTRSLVSFYIERPP